MIKYKWKVFIGDSFIHINDTLYDTEKEATKAAKKYCVQLIEEWNNEGITVDDDAYKKLVEGIRVYEVQI